MRRRRFSLFFQKTFKALRAGVFFDTKGIMIFEEFADLL
jgi:hypothetical protein